MACCRRVSQGGAAMSPATTRRGLPVREALRGRGLNLYDLLLAVGIIGLLYVVVKLGQAMTVNFAPGRTQVKLNTDVSNVPYYAARSLLRMFIALCLSTVFTLGVRHGGGPPASSGEGAGSDPRHPAVDPHPGIPASRAHLLHQGVPGQPARPRGRLDLRHLHLAGVEHDLQLLPLADLPADRARRGGSDVPADQVATVLEARRARAP